MSKTLGNVIDPEELLEEYGTDAVRYFLTRHISLFEDGDMTREAFKDAYNAHLANGLGNLTARIVTLAETHLSEGIRNHTVTFSKEYQDAFLNCDVNRAIDIVFAQINVLNQSITAKEPFRVVKVDLEAGKALIQELAEELYEVAYGLLPFMPNTAKIIQEALEKNTKPTTLFPRKE